MLENNGLAIATLKYMPVTVFAPINSAFQHLKINIEEDENLVLYHMGMFLLSFMPLMSLPAAHLLDTFKLKITQRKGVCPGFINHPLSTDRIHLDNEQRFCQQKTKSTPSKVPMYLGILS